MEGKLVLKNRDINASLGSVRKEGYVPGTVYGPNSDPQNVMVSLADITKAYKLLGNSKLIEVDHEGSSYKVLIRDLQKDPVRYSIQSVSFMKVSMDHAVSVSVPVNFVGVSMAVKNNIGFLVTPITEIPVKCLPSNIPQEYVVDIAKLDNVGDSIFVKDIDLGAGVSLVPGSDPYVMVATIVPPQKETRTETATVAATEAAPSDATPEKKAE